MYFVVKNICLPVRSQSGSLEYNKIWNLTIEPQYPNVARLKGRMTFGSMSKKNNHTKSMIFFIIKLRILYLRKLYILHKPGLFE